MLTIESTKFVGVPIRPFAKREREILALLVEGRTTKEIAYLLDLSARTVDNRVAGMCEKAGVWTRRELVVFAVRSEAAQAA